MSLMRSWPSAATTPWVSPTACINDFQLPLVGVPKTIDNDLNVTDFTFGFDTAVNIVIEAIDRLRTTSESHRRVMVVETMGRQAGWIACFSGIAAAADYVMVPEVPIDIDHCVDVLKRRRSEGKNYGIVVVSEGAKFPNQDETTLSEKKDEFGHAQLGGIAALVAQKVEKSTGFETRSVVLGHIQRGGAPSAYDRVLATRFGLEAAELRAPEAIRDDGGPLGDQDRGSPPTRGRGEPQEPRPGVLQGGRCVLSVRGEEPRLPPAPEGKKKNSGAGC